MDKYLDFFREMISLRGLTDHTLKITAHILAPHKRFPLIRIGGFLPAGLAVSPHENIQDARNKLISLYPLAESTTP